MNGFPHAPMPPGQEGPFDGVPMGGPLQPMHVDDFHGPQIIDVSNQRNGHGQGRFDNYDADFDNQGKKSKSKNNKDYRDGAYVDVKYEGYTLERALPRSGEKVTWGRVVKQQLPWNDKQLQEIAKAHRQKSRSNPSREFEQLTSKQQNVVNRLIEEQKLHEKTKNADWVLADVQRIGKRSWTSIDVRQIRVILRRQDKNADKKGNYVGQSKSHQSGEIIDLSDPIQKKKNNNNNNKGGKQLRRTRSDERMDNLDGFPMGGFGPPPAPPFNHGFQPPPMQDHFSGPFNAPNLPPPPPNMPFDPMNIGPFPGPPQLPPLNRRQSARRPEFVENPFQPDPHLIAPEPCDSPDMSADDSLFDQNNFNARARSGSQRRRSTTGRPSVNARRFSQLEDRVEDLNFKMSKWRVSDGSSEDTYEDDSIFSRGPPPDGRDYSEPSSPISQRSLERRKSQNRPRYRSQRLIEMEPAYSNREDRQYEGRRRPSRTLQRSVTTYDDYPRRLKEPDEGYDYEGSNDRRRSRDYRDQPSSRRRSVNRDSYQDNYEPARRDSEYDRRRQRSVGGGGGGGRAYYN